MYNFKGENRTMSVRKNNIKQPRNLELHPVSHRGFCGTCYENRSNVGLRLDKGVLNKIDDDHISEERICTNLPIISDASKIHNEEVDSINEIRNLKLSLDQVKEELRKQRLISLDHRLLELRNKINMIREEVSLLEDIKELLNEVNTLKTENEMYVRH